jgi:hypothetical protein
MDELDGGTAKKKKRKKPAVSLVRSDDKRALLIRDHLLPLIREEGEVEVQSGALRLTTLDRGPWTFNHWTPFNDLAAEEASSPSYRAALARQHSLPDLPYGLDVWRGLKVLSLLWSDTGDYKIVSYSPGAWEDEVLLLEREPPAEPLPAS